MFLTFVGADHVKAARRCKAAGIDLLGNEDLWEVDSAGVEATKYTQDGRVFTTQLQVAVRKNVLAVCVNPDLSEALGYTPAFPQYLYPGFMGDVTVVCRTDEEAAQVKALPWLVRLHVVPVTVLL